MQFKLRPRYNFTDANAFTDLVIAANLSGGFSVLLKNCYGGSVLIPDCDGGNPIGTAAGDERYLEIIRVFRSQFSTGWQGAERQLTALAAKGGDLPNAGVPFRKNLPSLESDHEQEAYAKACELAWRFYEKAGIEFLCVGVSIGPEGYAWTKVSSSRTSSFSPDIEFGVTPDGLVAVRVWGYWNKGEVPRTGSGGLRSTLVDDFMLLKPVPFSSELIIELENSLAEYHKSNSFSPLSWNIVGQLSTYPKIFKTLADLRLQ